MTGKLSFSSRPAVLAGPHRRQANGGGAGQVVEVLEALNRVGRAIAQDNDFSAHYFADQLLRYYYSLLLIRAFIPRQGRLLDLGSYPSHIHQCLLDMGYDVDGADIHPERISSRLPDCRARTWAWDFETGACPIAGKEYDAVLCLEVIEHLHVNPLAVLLSVGQLLRPGGLLFLSTPNLLTAGNRWNFLRGNYVFEHPLSVYEKLERHGSRGHQRLYSPAELADMLAVYGFAVEHCWCINEQPPLLSRRKMAGLLSEDFACDRFARFWRENKSWKGRLRLSVLAAAERWQAWNHTIYMIGRKTGAFEKSRLYEKICQADPWRSPETFSLQ